MNNDQQLVSWLAVFALILGVFFVYRSQLSAILFDTPNGFAGTSSEPPAPGNSGGVTTIQPVPTPQGQSGQFGMGLNGELYKWMNGQWLPWGDTAQQPGLA